MTINWGLAQLGVFLSAFLALVVAERIWPRRTLSIELITRWSANMGFTVVNAAASAVMRFLAPAAIVGAAFYIQSHGYGLLPATGAPVWVAAVVTFAALDLTLYGLHVACHRVALLWRFHRVHHVDPDVDATTAFRSHPAECLASQLCKLAMIVVLGSPALAVLAYEIVLNAFAMFSHANIRLGEKTDRTLRLFIVTPDMHRIHHSTFQPETDSNYGVVTPLWDRLFATYMTAPKDPQTTMKLGLDELRGREATNLFWLLAYPFISLKSVSSDTSSEQAHLKPLGATRVPVTSSLHTSA
jgi:sterol desaturase/sphingolipid hydroxylase (fatty acid hydroxylase superfamily)